jgi:hypothetical protein
MLPRRMQDLFLYEDDSTTGTATDTQPNKTGQTEPAKLFTQDDLDKHVGSARKAGREAAMKALLEELGLDSPDVLKTLVKSKKEEEEAKKSEEQKLRDALAQKDAEIAAEKKARSEAEALRLQDKRDSALKALLLSAHDPDGVLILLKAKHADKVNGLILDNGDIDSKAAETLVAEYKTNNAFQFKGDSKGSPSNAEGRLLKPSDDVRKEAAKDIKRKFNF